MGRGDKKTKKGKIWIGSYGVSRKKKSIKARLKRAASAKPVAAAVTVAVEEKPKAKRVSRKKESEAKVKKCSLSGMTNFGNNSSQIIRGQP